MGAVRLEGEDRPRERGPVGRGDATGAELGRQPERGQVRPDPRAEGVQLAPVSRALLQVREARRRSCARGGSGRCWRRPARRIPCRPARARGPNGRAGSSGRWGSSPSPWRPRGANRLPPPSGSSRCRAPSRASRPPSRSGLRRSPATRPSRCTWASAPGPRPTGRGRDVPRAPVAPRPRAHRAPRARPGSGPRPPCLRWPGARGRSTPAPERRTEGEDEKGCRGDSPRESALHASSGRPKRGAGTRPEAWVRGGSGRSDRVTPAGGLRCS